MPITRRGAPAGAGVEHLSLTDDFTELDLSPDGKKVAFVVRGEVFAASAKDGGDAARISRTPQAESQITWSPDSRTLAYSSDREGTDHLFLYDFATSAEKRLTSGPDADHSARFSADGKSLAFIRGNSELRVLDIASSRERVVAKGIFNRPPFAGGMPIAWSPDSRWLAYLSTGAKGFTNVYAVAVDGGTPQPVSFVANASANTLSWSADGRALFFDTGQRTEMRQIARVDLTPRTPQFREDQFRDLFSEEPVKPAPPSAPAPAAAPRRLPTPRPRRSPRNPARASSSTTFASACRCCRSGSMPARSV